MHACLRKLVAVNRSYTTLMLRQVITTGKFTCSCFQVTEKNESMWFVNISSVKICFGQTYEQLGHYISADPIKNWPIKAPKYDSYTEFLRH